MDSVAVEDSIPVPVLTGNLNPKYAVQSILIYFVSIAILQPFHVRIQRISRLYYYTDGSLPTGTDTYLVRGLRSLSRPFCPEKEPLPVHGQVGYGSDFSS